MELTQADIPQSSDEEKPNEPNEQRTDERQPNKPNDQPFDGAQQNEPSQQRVSTQQVTNMPYQNHNDGPENNNNDSSDTY